MGESPLPQPVLRYTERMTSTHREPIVLSPGDPGAIQQHKIGTLADAMNIAMQRAREMADDDPDPYGFGQQLEEEMGIDILPAQWKSRPGETMWTKRQRARARKAAVARYFLQGKTVGEIASKLRVSDNTVYTDIERISQEWRKQYLADIELHAGQTLARLNYMLERLSDGIDRGDTKSVNSALAIIQEQGTILGYRGTGVQVDITQMVREVAEASGFNPEKAVELATRISVHYR